MILLKKRRFFAPSSFWDDQAIRLDKTQSHHLLHVLRLDIGDVVWCFNESGSCAKTVVESVLSGRVILTITQRVFTQKVCSKSLTLAQSIIKSNRMDFVIQKAVELGVREIIPFFSDRCVIKLDADKTKAKLRRWHNIAVSAAKQSGRTDVAGIHKIGGFAYLLEKFSDYDTILVTDPYGNTSEGRRDIVQAQNILAVVGPEGGFSVSEYEAMYNHPKCVRVSINNNILRSETAALAVCAIVQYEWMP